MAHDHHHHDDDLYYLGQLGLVFFSALYAAFALILCLHWTEILNKLLGKQLQPYLLWSGIVLMVFAVARASVLWIAVGKTSEPHEHDHHHDHGAEPHTHHDHDDTIVQDVAGSPEGRIDEDDTTILDASSVHRDAHHHHHEHDEHCDHDHDHDHAHAHAETHHHEEHEDHDHGWAPLRYLVLALAIGLFFLLFFWGLLPFMGPQITAKDFDDLKIGGAQSTEAWQVASVVAMRPSFAQVGLSNALFNEPVEVVDYTTILKAADTAFGRKLWEGKMVQVWGQFRPSAKDSVFSIVRFRMQCCGADAVASDIPVISNRPIYGFEAKDWIKVTGKVHFSDFQGAEITTLRISGPTAIKKAGPDPDPYIQ